MNPVDGSPTLKELHEAQQQEIRKRAQFAAVFPALVLKSLARIEAHLGIQGGLADVPQLRSSPREALDAASAKSVPSSIDDQLDG